MGLLSSPVGLVLPALILGATTAMAVSQPTAEDDELRTRVEAVLKNTPLIDGHNDIPWAYRSRVKNHLAEMDFASDLSAGPRPTHTDLPRMKKGMIGGQFWSVFTPVSTAGDGAARFVFEQIDLVHRLVEAYPDHLEIAYGPADIRRAHAAGRIASLMGMEGGHCIENSLGVLRGLYRAGARYMTLAHSKNNDWVDSCTDEPRADGLTKFGVEVVREMNRMGMLVDLSHVSPAAMHDALDVAAAPVIFSHSSARALCDHPRNVPDDVLARIKDHLGGGVVMVTWVPSFVSEDCRTWPDRLKEAEKEIKKAHPGDVETIASKTNEWKSAHPKPKATLAIVADHIEHVRKVAGVNCVGIGGDLDGVGSLPVGLEDCTTYPDLLIELARRGWSDEDLGKLAGGNLLRVFEVSEKIAARLQKERPASDVLISELDEPIASEDEDEGGGARPPRRDRSR